MKKGILGVMIFAVLTCLACAHQPQMARVSYGSNGGRVEASSIKIPDIITSLNELPSDCLAEAEALVGSSDPNAAIEIDCSTGRFHLQARGSRSRVRINNSQPESQSLQGVLENGYRPNRRVDLTLTVSINEASGAPTAYQNIRIGPQEQRQLTLKPGSYIVKYRFTKSRWEEITMSPNTQNFRIILGSS